MDTQEKRDGSKNMYYCSCLIIVYSMLYQIKFMNIDRNVIEHVM